LRSPTPARRPPELASEGERLATAYGSTTEPIGSWPEHGFNQPQIAVIRRYMTEFSDGEYRKHVRDLGERYLATLPRPIAIEDA
jgi:hypothetical protein